MNKEAKFSDLLGKTITHIKGEKGDDELIFTCSDGVRYIMYHNQSCCESVYLEDVCGELNDLLDSPIVQAEENTSDENPPGVTPEYQDSFTWTWTFYRIATAKGQVVLRWYGESNGYYSESVDFEKL